VLALIQAPVPAPMMNNHRRDRGELFQIGRIWSYFTHGPTVLGVFTGTDRKPLYNHLIWGSGIGDGIPYVS